MEGGGEPQRAAPEPQSERVRGSFSPAGVRGRSSRTGGTLKPGGCCRPAGPRRRPARFPAAERGVPRPPMRRLGHPRDSPGAPVRGSPSGGAASSVPAATEGFRGPMAAGLAPGAAGGAAVLAEGGLVRRSPQGAPRGADVRGACPQRWTRPGVRPRTRWGTGGPARPGVGRRGGTARRTPAAGRADGWTGAEEGGAGRATSLPPLPSPLPQRRRKATPRPRPGARPAGDEARGSADATWLILPVVICLSQRLSHACASISNRTKRNCEWLIKSVIVYLIVPPATRITVVILELIRARNRDFGSGVFIGLENRRPPPAGHGRGGEPRGESR